MTDLVKSDDTEDLDASRAPLMDHLVELRRRLIWSALSVGITFGLAFFFVEPISTFLVQPLLAAGYSQMIFTGIMEAFFNRVKIAFFASMMLSFPVIATQLWLFIAPGLYQQERRAFLPFLIMTPVLFISGAALAYYFAVPVALHFLLSFGGDLGGVNQQALPSVSLYLDFITKFMFGFGVSFLLPVLLMLVERAGLVTRQQLQAGRRYAIVGAFVVAAVLTPPDVVSQLLLAVPLMLLFELSLIGIRITERKRARKAATTV